MKKALHFTAIFLMLPFFLTAQVIYEDDFESYTTGQGIALQSTFWDTWTGAAGTNEDPLVSDAESFSGNNAVRVAANNDAVLEVGVLTDNRYRIEFYIYIPSGRQAYYSLMQNFSTTGSNNVWGMQVFFQNNNIRIDGGGAEAATHTYQSDTWLKMQHFVDMDNDWADIYINDTLIHAYQWSQGTFNDGSGINRLNALNFYAWSQNGTPEFFIDDFIIEQVAIGQEARNLAYQIVNDNDVALTWSPPLSDTPLSYAVVRDGQIVDMVTDTTYTDLNVYPNTYSYQVMAFYGHTMGSAAPAGPVQVHIQGGNPRSLVLFEVFTGTWCTHCPTAARALSLMENDGQDIAVIKYHGGDSYETPITNARASFYSPLFFGGSSFGYPATIINGMMGFAGAFQNVAQQRSYYENFYDNYKSIPTLYTIDAQVSNISSYPYKFNLDVEVTETFAYFNDEMRLMVALTETDIPQNWFGLTQVKNVLRKMYPGPLGTPLNFSTDSTVSHSFELELESDYVAENMRAVVFVQNSVTGHVMEAYLIELGALVSGLEKHEETIVRLYPNPAQDILYIEAQSAISTVEVFDVTGRSLMLKQVDNSLTTLDVSAFKTGIYTVALHVSGGLKTYRFIKQ